MDILRVFSCALKLDIPKMSIPLHIFLLLSPKYLNVCFIPFIQSIDQGDGMARNLRMTNRRFRFARLACRLCWK